MYWIRNISKKIKWTLQRIFFGYSDAYYWDLGSNLGNDIVTHLKHFKNMKRTGYPSNMTESEWEETIDKMISGISFISNSSADFCEPEKMEEYREELNKARKDAHLFIENIDLLWD